MDKREALKNFYRDANGDIRHTTEKNIDDLSEQHLQRTWDQLMSTGWIIVEGDVATSRAGRKLN